MNPQEEIPLLRCVKKHIHEQPVSLHVPGHKNGLLYGNKWQKFLKYDLTEITGLDDLHQPKEAIKVAEELLRDYYGSESSHFVINGTTGANLAMILATVAKGERVLLPKDAHQSILNGLELAEAEPIFLTPQVDEITRTANGVQARHLEAAFMAFLDIKVCIFTYPSYYGTIFDLKACIEVAHRHGAFVLVDEAHGAHFRMREEFPESALSLGADIVTHSAHKTLPALTMGSFIHKRSDHPRANRLNYFLKIVQSSSPSYLIMISLDIARHYSANYTDADFQTFSIMQAKWKDFLEKQGFEILLPADPLKMIVRKRGYSGKEIQSIFEANGFYPEMADAYHVLLILPILKQGMEFSPRGKWKVKSREKEVAFEKKEMPKEKWIKLVYSFNEMAALKTEFLAFEKAKGRVAAETITSYPPGVPELIRGEKIKEFHINQLKNLSMRHYQGGEMLFNHQIKVFV